MGRHICRLYHSACRDFKNNITNSRIFFRVLSPCRTGTNETPGRKRGHSDFSSLSPGQGLPERKIRMSPFLFRRPGRGGSGEWGGVWAASAFAASRAVSVCGGKEAVHGRKEEETGHGRRGTVRIGTLEYWNIGITGRACASPPIIPSFHYSIVTPAGGVRLWAVL